MLGHVELANGLTTIHSKSFFVFAAIKTKIIIFLLTGTFHFGANLSSCTLSHSFCTKGNLCGNMCSGYCGYCWALRTRKSNISFDLTASLSRSFVTVSTPATGSRYSQGADPGISDTGYG